MLHRITKKNDIHADKWNGLGGKFIPGETPEECVKREVLEESGLHIISPFLKGFLTFPDFNDGTHWYVFVFMVEKFSGTLIDSPEGKLAWIKDEDIPGLNLWEGDRIFLNWLKGKKLFSGKFTYHEGKLTNHDVVLYDT